MAPPTRIGRVRSNSWDVDLLVTTCEVTPRLFSHCRSSSSFEALDSIINLTHSSKTLDVNYVKMGSCLHDQSLNDNYNQQIDTGSFSFLIATTIAAPKKDPGRVSRLKLHNSTDRDLITTEKHTRQSNETDIHANWLTHETATGTLLERKFHEAKHPVDLVKPKTSCLSSVTGRIAMAGDSMINSLQNRKDSDVDNSFNHDSQVSMRSEINTASARTEVNGTQECSRRVNTHVSNHLSQQHLTSNANSLDRNTLARRAFRMSRSHSGRNVSLSTKTRKVVSQFLIFNNSIGSNNKEKLSQKTQRNHQMETITLGSKSDNQNQSPITVNSIFNDISPLGMIKGKPSNGSGNITLEHLDSQSSKKITIKTLPRSTNSEFLSEFTSHVQEVIKRKSLTCDDLLSLQEQENVVTMDAVVNDLLVSRLHKRNKQINWKNVAKSQYHSTELLDCHAKANVSVSDDKGNSCGITSKSDFTQHFNGDQVNPTSNRFNEEHEEHIHFIGTDIFTTTNNFHENEREENGVQHQCDMAEENGTVDSQNIASLHEDFSSENVQLSDLIVDVKVQAIPVDSQNNTSLHDDFSIENTLLSDLVVDATDQAIPEYNDANHLTDSLQRRCRTTSWLPDDAESHKQQPCPNCTTYIGDDSHNCRENTVRRFSETSLTTVLNCKKCNLRMTVRKKIIQEIADTEKSYGRDLNILKEEFYCQMKDTSLLTVPQLDIIFINLEELIQAHQEFIAKITTMLDDAVKAGDESLASANIGSTFLQCSTMLLAFEKYCIHYVRSNCLLEQLEKEKELLHVFLNVTWNQNPKVRRMHLKSFLMVPVQRVMRYPLLLKRLYDVTPSNHEDKKNIKPAQEYIEAILAQVNAKPQLLSRRTNSKSADLPGFNLNDTAAIKKCDKFCKHQLWPMVVKEQAVVFGIALEALGWKKNNTLTVLKSPLWYGQVTDPTWASTTAKNVKFHLVHAILLTYGQNVASGMQVAIVLVKETGQCYQIARDPLLMDHCVIAVDPKNAHVFEIHEQGAETYLFKSEESTQTALWIQHLKQLSQNLGYWRRRRNGLPNIMLKTS